jgi:large subunit ribosomal protein L17
MRHRVKAGTLGRSASHRTAMYRNLVTSLFEHERVRTTDAKAKGVRSLAEKMITLGKRGDLHARRRALRVIRRREVAAKVFDDLAERYRDRQGGYTRIVKLGIRPGDAAAMSIIELVESGEALGHTIQAGEKTGKQAAKKGGAKAAQRSAAKATQKPAKKAAAKTKAEKAPAKKAPAKKAPKKKVAAKKGSATATKKKASTQQKATAKKKAVHKKKTD